ncbi:MAG: AAA family ATPase, partial [Shewanella sp.]
MDLDDLSKIKIDLAQVSRLALGEKTDDVRLFIAKLVRQYRESEPSLSEELAGFLRASSPRPAPTIMRRMSSGSDGAQLDIPVDEDSRLSLLKIYSGGLSAPKPILSNEIDNALSMLIKEREQRETLAKRGLEPSKSAIFVGAPGVGKTITARWIAGQLGVPLFVLD